MAANHNSNEASESSADKWLAQAGLYSNQASRLTELHGADLVTLLKDDILKNAKTILDVGCGTGAFAKAYIQQFPKGVPGQTLILSDLSPGMLEQAKATVKPPGSGDDDFQTKILFQEEDGTKLEGIADDSVDLVVSLFGVFLIPDQEAVRKAIQRVLKKPNGVVAIASWQFQVSDTLASKGFGVSLQDVFDLPNKIIVDPTKDKSTDGSVYAWASREKASIILSKDYKMNNVEVSSALHTTVWEFDNLWTMMANNPMSSLRGAAPEDIQRAKDAVIQFITNGGQVTLDRPLMLSTASNLCIGRGQSPTSS